MLKLLGFLKMLEHVSGKSPHLREFIAADRGRPPERL
jgi:hypothetical protein